MMLFISCWTRRAALPGVVAGLLGSIAVTPVLAQAQSQVQPESRPERPEGKPENKPATGPKLHKVPQTADEKSRLLNDLYAYLATADDEESAKPIAEAIERLWLYSGSDTVDLLMQRTSTALAAKNPTLALKFLDAIVVLAPDYAEGFSRRAYVHFTQSNLESAVGDLRRALALEPNNFKALDGLAQIWREYGNKKGALSVVKRLLEIHPNWPGAKQAAEELTREVEGQGI